MRAGKFLCAALCTLGTFALVPGVAIAMPTNQTPPQLLDQNSDPATSAAVGQTLQCAPGDWLSANSFQYEFKSDGTPIGSFGANDTYQVAQADIGHMLTCTVRATDTGDMTTADEDSSNSVNVYPSATVDVTRFSPAVSGNIGENVAGVYVIARLQRPDESSTYFDVADVIATTDASGAWSGTLVNTNPALGAQRAPFTNGDRIRVDFARGSAPGGTTLPPQETSEPDFSSLDGARIQAGGATASYPSPGDCADVKFVVNGGPPTSTTDSSGTCVATFGTAPSDEDSVVVRVSHTQDDGSHLTLSSPVGLVGSDSGVARCSGDLVTGEVDCSRLTPNTYTLTRTRGTVTQTLTVAPGGDHASATIPGGLEAGDVVTLKKQGGSRVLSTLHLLTFRVDVTDGNLSGGSCEPDHWVDVPCTSAGTFPSSSCGCGETDDLSGGDTEVTISEIDFLIPTDADSVLGSFQAWADTFGPAPTTLTLTLFHRNPDGSSGAQAGSPIALDPSNGGAVSGLAPGRYNAVWRATDTQGDGTTHDTFVLNTQIAVQPGGGPGAAGQTGANGSNGSNGTQGPAGPAGPRGPAGRDAKVTCVVKVKKHKPKITCTVKFKKSAGKVRARLMRGKRVYASGTSVGGKLRLNPRRALKRGLYKLVLIDRHGVRTVAAEVVVR